MKTAKAPGGIVLLSQGWHAAHRECLGAQYPGITMAATDIVEILERRILTQLEETAARLRRQYPCLTIHTYSSPIGSRTEYQGHDVGIDCLNPDALHDEPDNVALSIGVKHLTTHPLLCTAEVCWGAGGPPTGLDLLPEPVPWSAAALEGVEARLPELIQSLEKELDHLDRLGTRGA